MHVQGLFKADSALYICVLDGVEFNVETRPVSVRLLALLGLLALPVLRPALAGDPPARPGGELIPGGPGMFTFKDARGNKAQPLRVWTWRPTDLKPDSPVLIVMHGTSRDARGYRDAWVRHVETRGALLLVPEFSQEHYPGSNWYQLGNLHGSAYVTSGAVLDWKKLRRLLATPPATPTTPALARVLARVRAQKKGAPPALPGKKTPPSGSKALVIRILNTLIGDQDLYAAESFPKPPPRAAGILEWKKREKKELRGNLLRRLNRDLLEFALPGCLRPSDYSRREPGKWTYSALEHLFDHVRAATGGRQKGYLLYGHSAGAQFVHRLVTLLPKSRVRRAACANAGKYLWPDPAIDYPYGLGGVAGRRDPLLPRAFARSLFVMVGSEDTAEDANKDPNLPTSEAAMKQGKNRLERGRNFHRAALKSARAAGVECRWELHEVAGAAHQNHRMVPEAVRLLFSPDSPRRRRRNAPPRRDLKTPQQLDCAPKGGL
jgi:hypothetical protein